jgi:hypothetical protein
MDLLGAVRFGDQEVRRMDSAGPRGTGAACASAFPGLIFFARLSVYLDAASHPDSGPDLDRQSRFSL